MDRDAAVRPLPRPVPDADGTRHSQSFDRKADAKVLLATVVTDMARGE